MLDQTWDKGFSKVVYRKLGPGEALVEGLDAFARAEGITNAVVTSCIGSLKQLRLRNLCRYDEGGVDFERHTLDEILEVVSAEGYVQPLSEGGLRTHIHIVAARPSGEVIGGHCEEAITCTGAFMYLQVVE